jgi:FdhD protein
MRAAQANFDSTGGIHASGVFSKEGALLVIHEDVGRHNALDKVIGEGLLKGINFSECFLLVSGRISFELMQKAVAARLPLVAGISAPSSLAVSFAKTSGQSLIGFLRPPKMNVYN